MLSEHLNFFLCNLNVVARRIASDHNLSSSQYFTLSAISSMGINMTNLSKRVGIDNSTLTRNINILIKNKLVMKQRSSSDRRGFIIYLTAEGDKIINLMERQMDALIKDVTTDLNSNERESIAEILSKLNWKLSCYFNEL